MSAESRQTFVDRRRGDFWINALVGAVTSVVLSFTGFGIILGGGVAGYLQGGRRTEGAKVGAVSGIIASVPVILVLSLVFGAIGLFGVASGEPGLGALFGGLWLFASIFAVAIIVAFAALGGYLGAMLAE